MHYHTVYKCTMYVSKILGKLLISAALQRKKTTTFRLKCKWQVRNNDVRGCGEVHINLMILNYKSLLGHTTRCAVPASPMLLQTNSLCIE